MLQQDCLQHHSDKPFGHDGAQVRLSSAAALCLLIFQIAVPEAFDMGVRVFKFRAHGMDLRELYSHHTKTGLRLRARRLRTHRLGRSFPIFAAAEMDRLWLKALPKDLKYCTSLGLYM